MERAEAVRVAKRMRSGGATLTAVMDKVTEMGFRKPNGEPISIHWVSSVTKDKPVKLGKRKYTRKPQMITLPVAEEQPRAKMICLVGDAGEIMLAIKDLWR